MTRSSSNAIEKTFVRGVYFCLMFLLTLAAAINLGASPDDKVLLLALVISGVIVAAYLSENHQSMLKFVVDRLAWSGKYPAIDSTWGTARKAEAGPDLLTSSVLHNMRGTLTALSGELSLTMHESSHRRVSERLARMTDRVGTLTRQVEMLHNAYSDRPRVSTYFDLNSAVEHAIALRLSDLEQFGIYLIKNLAKRSAFVYGSPVLFMQAVLALIDNAIDAMKDWEGSRDLSIRTEIVGPQATVEITDSGSGIPASVRSGLFQYSVSTKRGAGVGLALTREIMLHHGGSIVLKESRPGRTTFCLEAPVETDLRGRARASVRNHTSDAKPARVLVVDDDDSTATVLSEMLQQRGYKVDVALSGRGALAKIRETAPDVILMDVCMPSLSGLDVLEQLRSYDPDEAKRVVLVTGYVEKFEELTQSGQGLKVIKKPFKFDDIENEIESVLRD